MGFSGQPSPCPHCRSRAVQGHGGYRRKDGSQVRRYRCQGCGRTFSQVTGSPAFRLRKRAEWNRMVELLTDYLPLRRVASMLGVSLSTAFRWRHRALAALAQRPRPQLEGRVCVGYFYIPYSEKGSRTCRGPGSWGYFNWLRKGVMDPTRSGSRFRLLIDGRPNVILVAQNEKGYQMCNLGQGRVTPEMLAAGLKTLVAPHSRVYGYDRRHLPRACETSNLHFRDASRALNAVCEGRTDAEDYWAELPRVPEYAYGWFRQFGGVATRYLEHYIVWYCDLVRRTERPGAARPRAPELDLLRACA